MKDLERIKQLNIYIKSQKDFIEKGIEVRLHLELLQQFSMELGTLIYKNISK